MRDDEDVKEATLTLFPTPNECYDSAIDVSSSGCASGSFRAVQNAAEYSCRRRERGFVV